MSKFFCTICVLLASTSFCFAQIPTSVTGRVKDAVNNALPAVSIEVLKAADSSLVKAGITEADGHFEIATGNSGTYLLRCYAEGYKLLYSAPFNTTASATYAVPDLTLEREVARLKEVIVSSKKPMIEVKADKMVFNVESSINATGSNALELLQKSPGVTVDNNENISLKGKTGVKVYVDGRMMQLDSKELAEYLKSINSNDIEAIEMISNPSAKYDASGNAGVINFRLKKNKKLGTNGSVGVTYIQGFTPKGNGSVNLNYRNKKVNIFGNFSGDGGKREGHLDLERLQNDTLYSQKSVRFRDNRNINLKAGADYFMTSKQTLGFLVTTSVGDQFSSGESNAFIYDRNGDFVKLLKANNDNPNSRTNNNVNLNYKYADTAGRQLNVDADYGLFRGRGSSWQPNYYVDGNSNLLYKVINRNYTPTDIDIYTIKADWEQRLGNGTLGLGVKAAEVITNNTFDFFDVVNDIPVKVLSRSNTFRYTENVNAAYVNYNNSLSKKMILQAGLRMENTASTGELTRADGLKQADDTVVRNYTNLFPSGALTYNVNKNNSFNLTYSRRIDRPSYQDLNPFETKVDELTYEKGNAFLRPQFTNTLELTHSFKGVLNTTIGYSKVHDFATEITDTVRNASYLQTRNLATQQLMSLNIGSGIPFAKWWSGYANVWFNYMILDGTIGNTAVRREIPMFGAYIQNSFTLPKNYSIEVSGWYNGPSVWGATWRVKPMGSLDIGAQKQFWDKKATVKLTISDVFWTSYWRSETHFGGLDVTGSGKGENRTARLSFTYRFGSSQVAASRERRTGLEAESGRIK